VRKLKLLTRASYVLYGYIFIMFLLVLFFNKPGTFIFARSVQIGCFVFATAIFLAMLYFMQDKRRAVQDERNDTKVIVLTLGLLFIIQVLFVSQFYNQTGFDADYIYQAAQGLSHPDFGPTYFSIYPNNLLLLFFERGVYKLHLFFGGTIDFYWLLVLLNIVAIDGALYLIYKIGKKVFGRAVGLYAFILGMLLFGLMPWLTSVYSDTLSLSVGLLIFDLYLRLKNARKTQTRIALGMMIGLLVQLGFLLKPSTIFIAIAIVLLELLTYDYKNVMRYGRRFMLSALVLGAIASGMYSTKAVFNYTLTHQQIVEYDESMNFPFTHWLMMGMQEAEYKGHPTYGFWSGEDFALTYHTPGKYGKIRAHLGVIKKRLQQFGVFGYGRFLWNKSIWILGDGTFFWGDEGVRASVTNKPGMKQDVQQFVYASGEQHQYYAYFLQTTWLLVLMCLSATLFAIKQYRKKEFFIISCTILGAILFVLLFEGRSRYIMNNLGFFVLGAGLGLKQILDTILNVMEQVKSKK